MSFQCLICGLLALCFVVSVAADKNLCSIKVSSGQILTIQKWKYSNCDCYLEDRSFNSTLPYWLLDNKLRYNKSYLIGLPSIHDIGTYDLHLTNKTCVSITIQPANSTDPSQFKCNIRWPTLAAVILDTQLTNKYLSPRQRIDLWNVLKQNLKGAAGIRILEDVSAFEKSTFTLANGVGNQDQSSRTPGIAVVWQIGCGSVEVRHLKLLQWLEKSALIGELSQLLKGIPVERWLVADLYGFTSSGSSTNALSRVRRQANPMADPTAFSMENIKFSGALLEGSGLPPPSQSPQNSNGLVREGSGFIGGPGTLSPSVIQKMNTAKPGPSTPYAPVIRRRLNKVVLTIQQINNFKIPRETFYDPQQGYSPRLSVKVYYISSPKNKNQNQEVILNDSNWISYDKDLQNIRFLPKPAQIGMHTLKLCASDRDRNKVCEKLTVEVRPPTPISKTTVLQIPAGALWTYKMPSQWLDGLTYNTTSDLQFSFEGNAIFCWDEKESILQVVTEAVESRILKITFNITNPREYQTLKYMFTLAVSDVSPISHVMSDIFQFQMRWNGAEVYSLNSINSFLKGLSLVLRDSGITKGYLIPINDFLIYRVLHTRDFRVIHRTSNPDDVLSLQIVYRPSVNATCARAALRKSVEKVRERQTISNFVLDAISRLPLKGRCNHSLKPSTTTETPKTTTRSYITGESNGSFNNRVNKAPDFDSKKLIQSLNVNAGHSFYQEINVAAAMNKKLVRYLSLVDERMKNVTDAGWVGLSINGSYIYGLPLKHHVRKEAYKFSIIVNTVTAHSLSAKFSITVLPNQWTNKPINHMVKLKLKLNSITSQANENRIVSSLTFRVNLVKSIDRLLTPTCKTKCSRSIILYDIKIIQKSLLSIEWSYLPVLEGRESEYSCPWYNMTYLFKALNGISNYPIDRTNTQQQIPAQALSDELQKAQIGSVVGLSIKRLGNCEQQPPDNLTPDARRINLLPNITAFSGQGLRVPIKFVQKEQSLKRKVAYVQLFYQTKVVVLKNHWITVSTSNEFIYALPMSIHTTEGREYVLHLYPQNGRKFMSPFVVTVLPNPFRGPNMNHEIRMRLAYISYKALTDAIIGGLDLRWKVAAALDSYLRPECTVSTSATEIPECAWRLDVILFEIVRVPDTNDLFDVKWGLRSVLQSSHRMKRRRRQASLGIVQCPERQLMELKRKLFSESTQGPVASPNLQQHMRSNAAVKVKKLDLIRSGPCATSLQTPSEPISRPNTGAGSRINQDDSQKMFLITTVIPVCAFTICILFVALMIALCMKRRSYSGYMKASQTSQLGPSSPVILPDEMDRGAHPPSKPLILPHEKPPLPPPEYEMITNSSSHGGPSFIPLSATITSSNGGGGSYRIANPNQMLPQTLSSSLSNYSRHNNNNPQTPSILSSPNSHDRFPHGGF